METVLNNSFDWAQKAYSEGKIFVAFDLETTGLDFRQDKIVEIGAVKFDNKGPIAGFSTLINPGIPMPAEAGRVNKITDEMLKGKPTMDEVFPDFLFFIHNTVLAAHNAPFDCGFINEKLKNSPASPFPTLPNPVIDTLVFSRERFPGKRSYSLSNLAAEINIPVQNAHRGENDARLCMEILILCMGKEHP